MEALSVIINITQEDIINGCRGHSSNCPTALALLRALTSSSTRALVEVASNDTFVEVDIFHSEFIREHKVYRAHHPKELGNWIHSFDSGEKVEPLSVKLEFTRTASEWDDAV